MSAIQLRTGSGLGCHICKVMGLESNLVRNMAINIPAEGFVTLDVQMNVTVEQAEGIKKELEVQKIQVNVFCEKK